MHKEIKLIEIVLRFLEYGIVQWSLDCHTFSYKLGHRARTWKIKLLHTSGNYGTSDIGEPDETGAENMSVCLTEKKCPNRLNSTISSSIKAGDFMLTENSNPASFLKQYSMKNTNSCEKASK